MIGRRVGRAALAAAVGAAALAAPLPVAAQGSYEYLQAFSSVLNHVRLNYVDSVGYAELVRAAIEGTLRSLDPHSRFVSRADWERLNALERGELAITGIRLEDSDSATVVLSVWTDSPADKAGVQSGDRVVAVDDTTTAGLRATDVELRLAGKKGSKVRVTLERGPVLQPDTLVVVLKRDDVEAHDVSLEGMLNPTTGIVRLVGFDPEAAKELKDAIDHVRKKGAKQLILDLRGNPGGLVFQALEVAGLFFPKQTLVFRTDGRKKSVDEDYVTSDDGKFREMPLVVLIDSYSASASEAVAGALQDHDRAILVGRRSFGKALMQTVFIVTPTHDQVWLTVARIQSPSGRIIQRPYKGVKYAQYRSLAGHENPADTATFRTDNGRPVHGGGGITPDILVERPSVPVWYSVAADSGMLTAVADSVAFTLPEGPAGGAAWISDPARWRTTLLPPLLDRVEHRLGVHVRSDSTVDPWIARQMAARTAEVRWGKDTAAQLLLQSDPDIVAALEAFNRRTAILHPAPTAGDAR